LALRSIGQALALREAVLRQPLGLTLSEEELEDDKLRTHFCAVKDGAVLGCVSLKPLEGRSLQLKQMAVEVDRRLEGIGAALVAHAEAWARDRGIGKMVLHARIGAEDFYAKRGYRAEGSIFDENTIPHIKMTKLLSERTSPHDLGGQL
jgi:N-acetylglutamate synthase-like GNAT family acetyltransferase